MDHWQVLLKDFPAESGDVLIEGGGIIGAYSCDENEFLEFRPNGSDEPVISSFNVEPFCLGISNWHKQQEAN